MKPVPPSTVPPSGPTTLSTARSSSATASVTLSIAAPSAVTAKATLLPASSRASSTTVTGKRTLRAPAARVRLFVSRVQSSVSFAVGVPDTATAIARSAPAVPPPATVTLSTVVGSSPSVTEAFESATSSAAVRLSTAGTSSCPVVNAAASFGVAAWSRSGFDEGFV